MTADVEVQYKVDEFYSKEHDRSLLWNDAEIGVEWPLDVEPVLSKKDQNAPKFIDAEYNF